MVLSKPMDRYGIQESKTKYRVAGSKLPGSETRGWPEIKEHDTNEL